MDRRELFRVGGWLALLAAIPAVAGCAGSPDAKAAGGGTARGAGMRASAPAPEVTRGRLLPVAAALYRAGLPGAGNAILSPYSIVSALGMLAYGARSATAAALSTALGADAGTLAGWLTGSDAALAAAVTRSKDAAEKKDAPDEATVIDPANALFVAQGAKLNEPFLDDLVGGYDAGVHQLDFAWTDQARGSINDWVADRTRRLIPELLKPGLLDANTLLVLVNALYLKAGWVQAFSPPSGSDRFLTAAGAAVTTPLMRTSARLNYATGSDWESVSIPLRSQLAMTGIVPRPGAYAAVSGRLDAALLAAATSGEQLQVELAMPAFTTDTPTDLKKPLAALGLGGLFDRPDLSGIAGAPGDIAVSGAIHQARIAVDQHGVEAAAATTVVMSNSAPAPVKIVRLEITRPFLYLIHDTATITPLFLGRVTDPTT